MEFIAFVKVFLIVWFCLLWGEDEQIEIEKSIQEGEFEMSVVQEVLDSESGAFVEIGSSGSVIIGTRERDASLLSGAEAYSLLDALYRHMDILRQRADTVPLQGLPEWAQPEHAPDGSNYHDERCRCPGCNYDGPEPTEEQVEQWQAMGTCQLDPAHTGRDVFRCDGCERMCCNQCGETVEDQWLCERCLAQEKVAYPF